MEEFKGTDHDGRTPTLKKDAIHLMLQDLEENGKEENLAKNDEN